jgi:hypothetical protein
MGIVLKETPVKKQYSLKNCLLAVGLLAIPIAALAEPKVQQVVKPPIAQYWMDVANNTMRIPGMPSMDEIPEMPELPFGITMPGMAELKNRPTFGNTKASAGRWVDMALVTQKKPEGTEATQTIPPGVKLGSSLPLVPTPQVATKPSQDKTSFDNYETPKGRILLYWGCGETVRKGQPLILDFSKKSPEEVGKFMFGRGSEQLGARNIPGHSIWPNDKDKRKFAKDVSLVGDHSVSGEGVPAGLTFQLAQAQDFMPEILLNQSGALSESIKLNWQSLSNARSYFINGMGSGEGDDMVFWTSSEVQETGFGLLDYLASGDIDRWLKEKVLLQPTVTQCAIPAGIFAKGKGGFVRMIAHGSELNIVNPPRPADVKKPWEPDWIAHFRTKSTTMTLLGGNK